MNFLKDSQIDFYQKNGYLKIEGFLSSRETTFLKEKAARIVEDADLEAVSIFTTDDQANHSDHYFLESGDKTRCFLEEGALDKNGKLTIEKSRAVNKIGHAMHDLDSDISRIAYKPELLSIALQIGYTDPAIVQSQFIFKQPRIGGKVSPHTDSTFITTDPLSCLGVWMALENADEENGCLCFVPGSHNTYPLQEYFQRNEKNTGTKFVNTPNERCVWDTSKLQAVPAKEGDLVMIHGSVIHASFANHSHRSRQSFILHMVDLTARWAARNWLQRPAEFPFKSMKNVVKTIN